MEYNFITLTINGHIARVELNRPEMANALNEQSWMELYDVFDYLDKKQEIRAITLSGKGKNFCGGIDISMLQQLLHNPVDCEGRVREKLLGTILNLQEAVTKISSCRKPVIAIIQGACVGAGLDIIAACDMRYASDDAFFSIKEVDMGMVADLGSIQRLPKLINDGVLRELAYTGRNVYAVEAKSLGLINDNYKEQSILNLEVQKIAETITSKSPLAIRGIKENINYSRDHTVEEGLQFVARWNAAMLLSNDIKEIFQSRLEKRHPQFKD
jgi:enoyl-CoA hydratase